MSYLYVLAVAAGNAGRHDLEERALARLLEVGQNSAVLHLLLGKAYLNRGEDDKALAELEQAAQADPKLPMVHYNLGMAYKHKRELEKAKEEFLKDSRVEPEVAYNYDELGTISLALEQNSGSAALLRASLEAQFTDRNILVRAGEDRHGGEALRARAEGARFGRRDRSEKRQRALFARSDL